MTRGRFDPSRFEDIMPHVPDVLAALRALPGVQDVRIGIDRATGRTVSLMTLDTLEHARFPREQVGAALAPLQALGWEPDAAELYEAADEAASTT
jgi:hypothetical protein